MSAATPFGLSSLPLLSIITWSPFVGALLIMFLARRQAHLHVERALELAGDRGDRRRDHGADAGRGQVAGDAHDAQAVRAVGRQLHLEHGIVEAGILCIGRAHRRVGRQL